MGGLVSVQRDQLCCAVALPCGRVPGSMPGKHRGIYGREEWLSLAVSVYKILEMHFAYRPMRRLLPKTMPVVPGNIDLLRHWLRYKCTCLLLIGCVVTKSAARLSHETVLRANFRRARVAQPSPGLSQRSLLPQRQNGVARTSSLPPCTV